MEPRIQYAQTADGVSIAYYAIGEGKPLVVMPFLTASHTQLEWRYPDTLDWYKRLSEHRKLVRYDGRGVGLSDRKVADYSLDALVLDLQAVVDHLGLPKFALFAPSRSGPVGVAFAVRHPERVSHLLLWNAMARMDDESWPPQIRVAQTLAGQDWEMFTETFAHVLTGWSAGEQGHQGAAMLRECITQEAYLALDAAIGEVDVTDLLPRVQSPTLVLNRLRLTVPPVDTARKLASRIPDAGLMLIDGESMFPFGEEMEAVATAIDEFLGEGEEATAAPGLAADIVHTILFTDVEGSTALTQRLGDAKARDLLREHERMIREALEAHGGSEVKTMGDGFMASFSSATKALECSIAMQRAFGEHNESAEEPILVRIGLNAGEPIAEDEDLFGTAVNLAARICAQAEAGQILAPIVVRELAAGKQFMFADLGETELRGFEDPVRLYELRWRGKDQ